MSADDVSAGGRAGHRDRHEHAGATGRPDDDELARRTERERVEAGLEPYDPDDVPQATDVDAPADPTQTEEYDEEIAVIRRQMSEGEFCPLTELRPFPPTHYRE